MKTLSRVFCATLLMTFFYACKKDSDKPPQLTVDRSAISLGVFQGYTDSFEIQSDVAWQLQVSPASAAQWMQVSATQGSAGKTFVKVSTIAAGTTTQTATISITPAGATAPKAELIVTQKIYAGDWKKIIGGDRRDEIASMARTSDGGMVIAGATYSDGNGDFPDSHGFVEGFIAKVDATGNLVWIRSYGGMNADALSSIAVTPDGGLIACGYASSDNDGDIPANHGNTDLWVMKLNADGTKIWSKVYGGASYDEGKSVAVTPDGGFLVLGAAYSENSGDVGPAHGAGDVWVLKLDQAGNIVWNKLLGGDGEDYGKYVVCNADGSSIVAAIAYSNNSGNVGATHGQGEAWVLKLDATGNIVWNKTFGGSDNDELYTIKPTPDNGFVLTGATESHNSGDIGENHGSGDAWVLKIDASGNKVWSKNYGGDDWEQMNDIAVTPEGDLVLTGYSASDNNGDAGPDQGDGDIWLLKLNNRGGKLWSKKIGGDNHEYAASVVLTGNGEIIMGGNTYSNNNGDVGATHGEYDAWLVKFK